MRTFFRSEPVICHAVAGVIVGTIASHIPGLDGTAAIVIAGMVFAAARAKVTLSSLIPPAKTPEGSDGGSY